MFVKSTAILVLFGTVGVALASKDASRLLDDLFVNYDDQVLPVVNNTDKITIRAGLALVNIQNIDPKAGLVELRTWTRFTWHDYRLRWDPAKFGGITLVRVRPEAVWKPDIAVYNSADEAHTELLKDISSLVLVYSDGSVLTIPPQDIRAYSIPYKNGEDLTFHVKIGSWAYDGFQLDLQFYEEAECMDLSDLMRSPDWEVVSAPAVRHEKYYPCCVEPYPDLTFNMTVRAVKEGKTRSGYVSAAPDSSCLVLDD